MTTASSQPKYRTRLEEILVTEGRKQTWLAEQVGLSRAMASLIVGGYQTDHATRAAIAETLGRTIEDCFPGMGT